MGSPGTVPARDGLQEGSGLRTLTSHMDKAGYSDCRKDLKRPHFHCGGEDWFALITNFR